jgi:uncharacterized membrane protein
MKVLGWFAWVSTIAVITHVAALLLTPYVIMGALNYSAGRDSGYGKLFVAKQAVHGKDRVVRSSPDLLYSGCAFKMDEGPLRISAPAIDSYMSISFFAHNTDNFFSLNDQQAPDGFDIVLARRGERIDVPDGARLVETDSPYGIVLLRYYLGDKQATEFDAVRQLARCESLEV